jgi:hypothetical protein
MILNVAAKIHCFHKYYNTNCHKLAADCKSKAFKDKKLEIEHYKLSVGSAFATIVQFPNTRQVNNSMQRVLSCTFYNNGAVLGQWIGCKITK